MHIKHELLKNNEYHNYFRDICIQHKNKKVIISKIEFVLLHCLHLLTSLFY